MMSLFATLPNDKYAILTHDPNDDPSFPMRTLHNCSTKASL